MVRWGRRQRRDRPISTKGCRLCRKLSNSTSESICVGIRSSPRVFFPLFVFSREKPENPPDGEIHHSSSAAPQKSTTSIKTIAATRPYRNHPVFSDLKINKEKAFFQIFNDRKIPYSFSFPEVPWSVRSHQNPLLY